GAGALGLSAFAVRVAAAPAAEAVTPALIAAAKKEGKITFYTAMDLQFAERRGKAFEAKYPGIAAHVERSGAERVFTRIAQEYSSNIRTVDVVNTSDQAHCIIWKRNGWLAAEFAGEGGTGLGQALLRPGRTECRDAHPDFADRVQPHPGEEGRRAEELQGSARSEMEGQAGQGAPGL